VSEEISAGKAARLTEREREILRLVPVHGRSKLIATCIGIDPDSVDKAIQRAMAKLGVATRHEAARLLAAYEAAGPSGNPDSPPPPDALTGKQPLVDPPDPPASDVRPQHGMPGAVGEVRMPFAGFRRRRAWLPYRTGDAPNDLTPEARLAWILLLPLLMVGAVLAAAGIVASISLIWLAASGRLPA